MFKPQRLTFDELSERLRTYERRYGYSTIEFYCRYQNGELGDDDDLQADIAQLEHARSMRQ